jgi:ketosteroid isomerase-like protein
MRAVSTVALAVLVAAAASAPPQAPAAGAVDSVAVFQGLDALRTQYIAAQTGGDPAALAALHADAAGLDLFGLPRLRGRPAIQAAVTADLAARKYTLVEITPFARNARTNTEATELGTYHDMHDAQGKVDHEWGRYLGAFVKGADGQWKIQYLMAFPDSVKVGK